MNIEDALAKLDALPRRIDAAEIGRLSAEHSGQSMEIRRFRFAMTRHLRSLAREIIDNPQITDLEFNVIMSRTAFEAVRILAQLELTESDTE